MSNIARMMQRATAGAGGAGLDVDEVFSTFLYDGTGSAQTITNDIDLSGEGGLVWTKVRSNGFSHALIDTERGVNNFLKINATNAQDTGHTDTITSFNSNGYSLGSDSSEWFWNRSGEEYVSWTFRKARKFFDVVTWTGDGTSGRSISHNLGSTVGAIFMKRTDTSDNWYVGCWNGMPHSNGWKLNTAESVSTYGYFGSNAPTSTSFEITNFNGANASGGTYVAYVFAHNNNDGEFGPDGDQDIIKFGKYTGNGSSSGPTVDLGFEPQWILIKNSDGGQNYVLVDVMRGITTGSYDRYLYANGSLQEDYFGDLEYLDVTSTGFSITRTGADVNASGDTYIYMAIRRGPLAAPEDATKVFDVFAGNDSSYKIPTGFVTDLVIGANRSGSDKFIGSRLTGRKAMRTNTTQAEGSGLPFPTDAWQYNDGVKPGFFAASTAAYWLWKRAPSYFDVVCYTGNQTSGRTVSHNLGTVPEMMWVKRRSDASDWKVYHSALGNTKHLNLNETIAAATDSSIWNNTTPTASVFTLGYDIKVNGTNSTFVAYLFATVAGVSKVGSYTGNSSDGKQIDCGFSNGARFVLLKNTTVSNTNWLLFDTVRGIVAGNDARLYLNSTDSEHSGTDYIDPYSSGFALTANAQVNYSGSTYIFYAIA